MTSFNPPYHGIKKWSGLAFWLLLCYFTAWIGAQTSPGIASAEWYESIHKPAWNPPAWLFGPVWTTLYTLMGISAWMVWNDFGFKKAGNALSWFLVQLVLNGAWSWIFFGTQQPGWALVEIMLLLAAIVVTTYLFYSKNRLAGLLMVPYLLWVSFATVLNGAIWWLN